MNKFAIVDIETTGGSFKRDRIIEIAIIIHDGKKELSRFETLINPEITIPPFITKLTGIRQEMVEDAPYFYEVAKEIVLMTEDCIFVAHNVRFDYGFVRYEFERLGYTYSRKRLCTIKMARKSLELPSYGMDQLIRHFNITIEDRHRAMGDAAALAQMFPKLFIKEDTTALPKLLREDLQANHLPEGISLELYKSLPQDPGVYYMLNEEGYPVYIGKSNNIKKRIYQHFSQKKKSAVEFDRLVKGFRFELTGSNLMAELKEALEIKKYLPILNRAQRNNKKHYFSYLEKSDLGHELIKFSELKGSEDEEKHILRYHTTKKSASGYVYDQIRSLGLCACIQNGVIDKYSSCIQDQMDNCDRALYIDPELYNEKFEKLRSNNPKYPLKNGAIIIESAFYNQTDYVLIENGIYQGYGTLHSEETIMDITGFRDHLVYQEETLDVLRILKSYFAKKNGKLKKVKFSLSQVLRS